MLQFKNVKWFKQLIQINTANGGQICNKKKGF